MHSCNPWHRTVRLNTIFSPPGNMISTIDVTADVNAENDKILDWSMPL